VKGLWQDDGVQEAFSQLREYHSASYYFDAIDQVGDPEYMPTDQDILHCRVLNNGIKEVTFDLWGWCTACWMSDSIPSTRNGYTASKM
jgi:guanine nucleotide-binding protein subunit alpha